MGASYLAYTDALATDGQLIVIGMQAGEAELNLGKRLPQAGARGTTLRARPVSGPHRRPSPRRWRPGLADDRREPGPDLPPIQQAAQAYEPMLSGKTLERSLLTV